MTSAASLVAVVTYEPTAGQLEMLGAQLGSRSLEVVVWDNSTSASARRDVQLACEASGFTLLRGSANEGTGVALNAFVRHASASGHEWFTYFDQDSRVPPAFLDLLGDLAGLPDDVAAVGATYDDASSGIGAHSGGSGPWPARYVIASGTSWRVSALKHVDGADEAMFLDLVDHELCLRLRRADLRILVDPRRRLAHAIGEDGRHIVGPFAVTRHPSWRRVMMWRNSTILVRRYGTTFPLECARHVLVRCAETLVGTVVYRKPSWMSTAARGVAQGLRGGGRRGLSSGRR